MPRQRPDLACIPPAGLYSTLPGCVHAPHKQAVLRELIGAAIEAASSRFMPLATA